LGVKAFTLLAAYELGLSMRSTVLLIGGILTSTACSGYVVMKEEGGVELEAIAGVEMQ
jgi:hypothetical protein